MAAKEAPPVCEVCEERPFTLTAVFSHPGHTSWWLFCCTSCAQYAVEYVCNTLAPGSTARVS